MQSKEAVTKWTNHEFYQSALVLGLDIGIKGIGVWLRKGRKPIFAHTFIVSLPEAAPLKNRRQKRAWRHARQSRERRERMLQEWIIRYGLLSPERLKEKWNNPSVFERAFEHRHRAITNKLGSPEALVVCLRHIVKHRGYDYHLTEEGAYPWGDELNDKEILQWAKHTYCAPQFRATLLTEIQSDVPWAKDARGEPSEKYQAVDAALVQSVAEYENHPIERMLESHLREKNHPHLRERARGHNFPRELVKLHLFQICENHRHFFAAGQYEKAMSELLGERDANANWKSVFRDAAGAEHQTIMDYHRRTPEEAERLWLRKTKDCPFATKLHELGKVKAAKVKCDFRSDARVRRFNLLMFLAERRIELATSHRMPLTAEMVKVLSADLEQDVKATDLLLQKDRPETDRELPSRTQKPGKRAFEERFKLKLGGVKEGQFNKDFFDQIADLLRPELRKLRDRASLCGESAQTLYRIATKGETVFEPEAIKQALRDCGYYDWRKSQERGLGFYPQVEFLLGQRKHYNEDATPRDVTGRRNSDGKPQYHGILRKLFAGQLRLDDGTVVNLADKLDGKAAPDFVVVETIGDIPRNLDERRERQKEIKASRARKKDIIETKYRLNLNTLSDARVRRVLLFDQQANDQGEARCPFTNEPLGSSPLSEELEIEHVFPESRGGISIMENLVITKRTTNQRKNDRTPWEWLVRDERGKVDAWLAPMHWNPRKRVLFCCEGPECPQWDNTTRMAQLARHLRTEVIHWLGIRRQFTHVADSKERDRLINQAIWEKVGTPTGFQTGACREAWVPITAFPKLYREIVDKAGRTRWIKNRDNLRHHLWDAAVLSHIPPGLGMNSASYGGIFLEQRDSTTRDPKTSALPGFGPNLDAFEKGTAERCMVSSPRQAKSKKSRYKQTILSPPDGEGKMWAREPLEKYTSKKGQTLAKVRLLLDQPGLLRPLTRGDGKQVQLLRDQDLERWWDGVQDLVLDQRGLVELLGELGIESERIPPVALAEQFTDDKPQRKFSAKHLLAFLRKKCAVKADELPDSRVEDALRERAASAVLRAPNGKNGQPGQIIRSVRIEQDQQAFLGPHYKRGVDKPELIGRKAVDNSTSVIYLRREIWVGSRLKKKGKQSITEVFYEHRLIPHPRHLAAHEKIHGKKWQLEPLQEGMKRAGNLAVGDLLRVPIAADYSIAKRGQPAPLGYWFYRVSAMKTSGSVKLHLAEFNLPKVPEGRKPDPETERLLELYELLTSVDSDLAWLIENTTGQFVSPPAPAPQSTTGPSTPADGCLL